jgi:hypothetical protein
VEKQRRALTAQEYQAMSLQRFWRLTEEGYRYRSLGRLSQGEAVKVARGWVGNVTLRIAHQPPHISHIQAVSVKDLARKMSMKVYAHKEAMLAWSDHEEAWILMELRHDIT